MEFTRTCFRNAHAFQDRIGIWKCWFLRERGKPEYLEKKLSEKSREQQQTGLTYDAGSGNRTRKHWWEVSTLTTTPSLLPYFLVHPSHSYKPWHKSSCLSVLLLPVLECPQKFRKDTSCKRKNLLALSYQIWLSLHAANLGSYLISPSYHRAHKVKPASMHLNFTWKYYCYAKP